MPFSARTRTFSSRKACELAKWAEGRGVGFPFHIAVYRAYFARGKNIATPEVLQAAAEDAGLDSSEVQEILDRGVFREAVDADWDRCRRYGVTAVPTVRRDSRQLVGFQSPSNLLDFYRDSG